MAAVFSISFSALICWVVLVKNGCLSNPPAMSTQTATVNGGPIGRKLPKDMFTQLCSLTFPKISSLCKGGSDIDRMCADTSYQLYFEYSQCQSVAPEGTQRYMVCACTNNSAAKLGNHHDWTYVTAGPLGPELDASQSCKSNGLKVLYAAH